MSTEHNFTTGSVQYNWIKDTLSKVDRKQTPWLIFAGHRLGTFVYIVSGQLSTGADPGFMEGGFV